MGVTLKYSGLRVTFHGVEDTRYGARIAHYRNIPYATIPKRFAKPHPVEHFNDDQLDCTNYGPQCPQRRLEVRELLRIPEEFTLADVQEDEFKCLNLNVTLPTITESSTLLPVIIWIHGGSQTVTFPSAASQAGDPTRLVAQSLKASKPVIFVTFNYRLNIFAFGEGGGEKNLALQDQRVVLAWVRKHIKAFGGDPSRITLAGESAGAVYVHAHLVTDANIYSGILASGSLYLSPPLPEAFGRPMLQKLNDAVKESCQETLATAPVSALIQAQDQHNIVSMWLQEEPALASWQSKVISSTRLIVGDVEMESIIWRNGVEAATPSNIAEAFDTDAEQGASLRRLYGIVQSRGTSSRSGALDFITDVRFALPAEDLWRQSRERGNQNAFRYLFDEHNPWHYSGRAHHAVDLLFLFGGFDFRNPLAERVGEVWREKWIDFSNGEDPWKSEERFAFGPHGRGGVLDEEEYKYRRREGCFEILRQMTWARYNPIFQHLATGRMSLSN